MWLGAVALLASVSKRHKNKTYLAEFCLAGVTSLRTPCSSHCIHQRSNGGPLGVLGVLTITANGSLVVLNHLKKLGDVSIRPDSLGLGQGRGGLGHDEFDVELNVGRGSSDRSV